MSNLFSPNADVPDYNIDDALLDAGLDDADIQILEKYPPVFEPYTGDPTRYGAKIVVRNLNGNLGAYQSVHMSGRLSSRDAEQLAYLAGLVYDRTLGDVAPIPPAFNDVDWAPGLRQFAGYVINSNQSAMPPAFANVLTDGVETYIGNMQMLRDLPPDDAPPPAQEPRADSPPPPPPPPAEDNSMFSRELIRGHLATVVQGLGRIGQATNEILEQFLGLRLWDDVDETPPWLEFINEKHRWLTVPEGKWKNGWVKTLPPGSCALQALACSGVADKILRLLEPAKWTGVSVRDVADLMVSKNLACAFYDSLGRRILKIDGAGKRHSFLAANGHLSAFAGGVHQPFKLVAPVPMGTVPTIVPSLKKHYRFSGPNTLETTVFYNECGIRPPNISCAQTPDLMLDINKAYLSFMVDPDRHFPVPEDKDAIEAGEERLTREEILPTGFYLVRGAGFLTTCERMLLRAPQDQFWMLGAALTEAFPDQQAFEVTSRFICSSHRPGRPHTNAEKAELVPMLKAAASHNDPTPWTAENTKARLLKQYHLETNWFTGVLEKSTSTSTNVDIDLHSSEVDYLAAGSRLFADYTTIFKRPSSDDPEEKKSATITRCLHWKTTGRMAKLALYSYTISKLILASRRVRQVDKHAELICSRTDSIGFSTTAKPEQLADLIQPGVPGMFKVQSYIEQGGKDEQAKLTDAASRDGPRTLRFGGVTLEALPAQYLTPAEVETRVANGWTPRMMLLGPPGSGKTYWMQEKLKPALDAAGVPHTTVTQMVTHATRLKCATNASVLSSTHCFDAMASSMKDCVLFVDECGLALPNQIQGLDCIRSKGLVLIGDGYQLSALGDPELVARRLGLPIVRLDFHQDDRYSGDKRMHNILRLLIAEIETQKGSSYASGGYGSFPQTLIEKLEAAGLPFCDDIPTEGLENTTILGWRHKYTTELAVAAKYKGTIHSSQGTTLSGKLLVTDWRLDPKYLFTAISRARSLDDILVLRNLPEEEKKVARPRNLVTINARRAKRGLPPVAE